jgi:peptidoglycan/xylan/chitin deacetylase (PgdA/CDA1 family)
VLRSLKHAALAALTRPAVLGLVSPFTRGVAPILMLHRFADPETGTPGHAPGALRRQLAFLRRHRYDLAPLGDLVARLERGAPPLHRTIAFTVDDGYADFARVGAPVFAEFDCPVTLFAVTGFLDGRCWMWWDQVELAFGTTRRTEIAVELPGAVQRYRWSGAADRGRAAEDLVERLKLVGDADRRDALARLARDLDVDLPAAPPPRYAPMTWDEARRCAGRGATFGPHTVTHPILSRVGDAQAEEEIRESWRRVKAEVPGALPVFCYPNGDRDSFTPREQRVVRELGLAAAVTTVDGFASPRGFRAAGGAGRFAVPRFAYEEDDAAFRQIVAGLERAKRVLLRPSPSAF